MVKRYEGNSGRVVSVPEPAAPPGGGSGAPRPSGPGRRRAEGPLNGGGSPGRGSGPFPGGSSRPGGGTPGPGALPGALGQLPLQLQRLLSRGLGDLETEDLLLMLILYLLYRESGDRDWLMTLGAMLFV